MRVPRSVIVLVSTLCMIGVAAGAALAGDPPGNNGTVKVNGAGLVEDGNNDAHVDCQFQIDFFGFDQGVLTGTASFDLQPQSGPSPLFESSRTIGEDAAGGGTDFDGSLFVDLSGPLAASGVAAQPNQGFHVKLTVHADGSIGNDTKHKTFWVDNCGGEGGGEG
jgi:hypothetical protein